MKLIFRNHFTFIEALISIDGSMLKNCISFHFYEFEKEKILQIVKCLMEEIFKKNGKMVKT